MATGTIAHIALGSNVGDRRAHLDHALARCGDLGSILDGSPIYETTPVGGPDGQGPYLNAVLRIECDHSAEALLEALLAIERERGRDRTDGAQRWGPRTLDLDLLTHGDAVVARPGLTLPHPRMRDRPFVLIPLTDIDPGIGDAGGPFAAVLGADAYDGIRRISGPVHDGGDRWMIGLDEATTPLSDDGHPEEAPDGQGSLAWPVQRIVAHPDWTNTVEDAFGGFLAAVAIRAAAASRPEHAGWAVSQMTYRYLRPVPAGAVIELRVVEERSTQRSRDVTVLLDVAGERVGAATMAFTHARPMSVDGPVMPETMQRWEADRADRMIASTGRSVGQSVRSWTALERWDVPDLVDGTERLFRAWSPHPAVGSDEPALAAAAIFMPIDAMIWRATMQRLGQLGHLDEVDGTPDGTGWIGTPTIEITVRFAGVAAEPWYLSETMIDHVAGRAIAGTVRVWGMSGTYTAIGHSLNLLAPGRTPTDGL